MPLCSAAASQLLWMFVQSKVPTWRLRTLAVFIHLTPLCLPVTQIDGRSRAFYIAKELVDSEKRWVSALEDSPPFTPRPVFIHGNHVNVQRSLKSRPCWLELSLECCFFNLIFHSNQRTLSQLRVCLQFKKSQPLNPSFNVVFPPCII